MPVGTRRGDVTVAFVAVAVPEGILALISGFLGASLVGDVCLATGLFPMPRPRAWA